MPKYFIKVKRNGHLFSNIIATLHQLGAKYRNLDNKIVPLYPLYIHDNPRIRIGTQMVSLTDIRIIEGVSASAITSYYRQIEALEQGIVDEIKRAKKRNATVEDFRMKIKEED